MSLGIDKDLLELHDAMDAADEIPGCTNDPDLFFLDGNRFDYEYKQIAAVCSVCPIRALCFAYGYKNSEEGVWGGTTASERRRMKEGNKPLPKWLDPVTRKRVR